MEELTAILMTILQQPDTHLKARQIIHIGKVKQNPWLVH